MNFILLPGIYGSNDEHWQSFWEQSERNMTRFQPDSWDEPELQQWVDTLDRKVAATAGPSVLVAHSLACLLVAHWSQFTRHHVEGAFLVSVPNPDLEPFPAAAAGFANVPEEQFKFPSMIVASTNDPFGTLDYMRFRAAQWGSDFMVAGSYGHINGASGLGAWQQGRQLLAEFAERIAATSLAGPGDHAT